MTVRMKSSRKGRLANRPCYQVKPGIVMTIISASPGPRRQRVSQWRLRTVRQA